MTHAPQPADAANVHRSATAPRCAHQPAVAANAHRSATAPRRAHRPADALYAQVKRNYRLPEGLSSSEVDADSDGDVLVVLDLRVDSELTSAGVARELVNRWGLWSMSRCREWGLWLVGALLWVGAVVNRCIVVGGGG